MISDFEIEAALDIALVRGVILSMSEEARSLAMYGLQRRMLKTYNEMSWQYMWLVIHRLKNQPLRSHKVFKEETA